MSPDQLIRLCQQLNRPIGEQFVEYLGNPFASTINSTRFNRPVWEIIGERVWPTVLLVGMAVLLAALAGVWLGIRSGWRRGSRVSTGSRPGRRQHALRDAGVLGRHDADRAWLPFFPSGGINPVGVTGFFPTVVDTAWHLVLPRPRWPSSTWPNTPRSCGRSLVDELRQDYLTPRPRQGPARGPGATAARRAQRAAADHDAHPPQPRLRDRRGHHGRVRLPGLVWDCSPPRSCAGPTSPCCRRCSCSSPRGDRVHATRWRTLLYAVLDPTGEARNDGHRPRHAAAGHRVPVLGRFPPTSVGAGRTGHPALLRLVAIFASVLADPAGLDVTNGDRAGGTPAVR